MHSLPVCLDVGPSDSTCKVFIQIVTSSIFAIASLMMLFFYPDFLLQTVDEIYKVASISLSPNVPAQIFVSWIWMFLRYFNLDLIYLFKVLFEWVLFSFLGHFLIIHISYPVLQMGVMLHPPQPGDISYDKFVRER